MQHFVTGGSGFVGMHLVERLVKDGEAVVIYDIVEPDASVLARKNMRYVAGDICDLPRMREAMRGAEIVHHNAAILPLGRPGRELYDVNVEGTRNVLEAALAIGARKVIAISSSSIFGIQTGRVMPEDAPATPIDAYGASKAQSEEVCRAFRSAHPLDVSVVRPCPIIGTGRMGIFGILFDWIAAGKRVYTIGQGTNPYQFVSVDDLVDLCVTLAHRPAKNEDFNAGSAAYGTAAEDLEALIRHAGTGARLCRIPAGPTRAVLRILDWLRLSPLVRYHYMTADKPHRVSMEKANRLLGWTPRESNIDVLTRTYDWYLAHRDELATMQGSAHRTPLKQGILRVLRFFS